MKNTHKISNLQELKEEIARVEQLKFEQETYLLSQYDLLKLKMGAPRRFFNAITSAIPGGNLVKGLVSSVGKATKGEDADWLTRALQLGAPLLLNSTLLRNSGWLKKALVLLASETAVGQVNQSKVSGIINKVTGFIRPKKEKEEREKKAIFLLPWRMKHQISVCLQTAKPISMQFTRLKGSPTSKSTGLLCLS